MSKSQSAVNASETGRPVAQSLCGPSTSLPYCQSRQPCSDHCVTFAVSGRGFNEIQNTGGMCCIICVALAGCGTSTQGTSQNITITSAPPGARCDLKRTRRRIWRRSAKTPGVVKVDKTKNDIMLTCDMAGYQQASVNLESGYGAGTFGNIIFGGVIGWGMGSATGADNKYPSSASVRFIPVSSVAASVRRFYR